MIFHVINHIEDGIIDYFPTCALCTKPLINACKIEIMAASKRTKFVSIVVIFKAYSFFLP